MPSMAQVAYHNANLEALRQAQVADQSRLAREQAELQRQRDEYLADQQRQQNEQAAGFAAQQQAAQSGYAQQAQLLGANLQQRRDYQGHLMALDQAGQAAGFQTQRDANLSGQRMNEQSHQTNLQAQLSQVQLNQQEEMRMRADQRAIAEVQQKVRDGYLDPEEGALLETKIRTGLNPMENRSAEAARIQTQLRSQMIQQENEQQATLFAQRQQRLAAGAAANIQSIYNPDTGENERYMVDVNTGGLTPLESSSIVQARQQHMLESGQIMQQRQQMFPGQLEGQRLGNANTAASTEAALSGIRRAEAMQPGQLALLNQAVAQGPQAFQSQQAYEQARTAALTQQIQQGPQAFRSEQDYRQAQTEVLRMNVAQGPQAFQSQQAFEAARTTLMNQEAARGAANASSTGPTLSPDGRYIQTPNGWVPNSASNNAETQMMHRRETLQRIAHSVDSGMQHEIQVYTGPPSARPAWMTSPTAYTAEHARRTRTQHDTIESLLNPQQERAGPHGAPGTTPINRNEPVPLQVQQQNLQQELGAAAANAAPQVSLAAQREQMPATIDANMTHQLATVATEAYNGVSFFERALHYNTLGRISDVARRASSEGRGLTAAERAVIQEALNGVQFESPQLAARIRAQLPGFSRTNVANPLQDDAPFAINGPGF